MPVIQRLPDDTTLMDLIGAGINTIPGIIMELFGEVHGNTRAAYRSKLTMRLNSLERYQMIQRGGWTEMNTGIRGQNRVRIWEVCQ